jgi:hypothetical protein
LSHTDENGENIMHRIAKTGDMSLFLELTQWVYENDLKQFLISMLNQKNSSNNGGNTPLHIAVMNGWHELSAEFIKNGADKKIPNNNQERVASTEAPNTISENSTENSDNISEDVANIFATINASKKTKTINVQPTVNVSTKKPTVRTSQKITVNNSNSNSIFQPSIAISKSKPVSKISQSSKKTIATVPVSGSVFANVPQVEEPKITSEQAQFLGSKNTKNIDMNTLSKFVQTIKTFGDAVALEHGTNKNATLQLTDAITTQSQSQSQALGTDAYIDNEIKKSFKTTQPVTDSENSIFLQTPQNSLKFDSAMNTDDAINQLINQDSSAVDSDDDDVSINPSVSRSTKKSGLANFETRISKTINNIIDSPADTLQFVENELNIDDVKNLQNEAQHGGSRRTISGRRILAQQQLSNHVLSLERIIKTESDEVHQRVEEKIRKWLKDNKKSATDADVKAYKSILYQKVTSEHGDKANLEKALVLEKLATDSNLKNIDPKKIDDIRKNIEEKDKMRNEKKNKKKNHKKTESTDSDNTTDTPSSEEPKKRGRKKKSDSE